jgi:excisionase family DNA binding protein
VDKEILNMEEAAELFGVSVKTFIKLLKEESVPGRKIGREWRFGRKALIDWLSLGDSKFYSGSEVETKEFFNEVAEKWEELRKDYYDESILNKLLDLNLLEQPMTVLDLGAGDGFLSMSIAKKVNKVVAIDVSKGMLQELEKKASQQGLKNIETLVTVGMEIPLEDSSMDLVCASMVLHHMEEPEFAVKEIFRIAKPGAVIFIADFIEHKDQVLLEKMHDLWAGFKTNELMEWVKQSGFKNIHLEKLLYENNEKQQKQGKIKKDILILTAQK